jgi:para-aminobenzoate synthetase component I
MIGNGNDEPSIVLFCRQDHLRVTFKPVVVKIAEGMSPREALRRLADLPHCLLLESSLRNEVLGRFSFLAADPVEVQVLTAPTTNPLATVQASLDHWKTERVPSLPPFQGGWAGLLGYDLGQSFEVLPQVPNGAVKIPVLCLGLYDVVIAWDHLHDECWPKLNQAIAKNVRKTGHHNSWSG